MNHRIRNWSITLVACAAMVTAGCGGPSLSSTSSTTRMSTQSTASGGGSKSAFIREADRDWTRLNNAQKLAKIEEVLTGGTSIPAAEETKWAMKRLIKLVERGYAGAQYQLGAMKLTWQKLGLPIVYNTGPGAQSALVLMQKAAAQNHPEARYQLARFHMAKQEGVEATRELEKSANSGYVPAMAMLGFMHRIGAFSGANFTSALAWAEKGANAGDAESMVLAGQILRKSRPSEKAARDGWFAKAAALEHLEGMNEHAFAAWPAQGGGGNIMEAAARLRRAVDVGKKKSLYAGALRPELFPPADSLFNLSIFVELIRRDKVAGARFTPADSTDLLKKAAKAGNARASAVLEKRGITP